MAIPGPGPSISMTTLNTEFGGGFALSSYYRGGAFVPNTPTNAAIPTSGAIALGNFYGSSNRVIVSLTATGNNYDVYTNRGPSYIAGNSDLTVTVPGTVGSANTGSYAMLVPSAFSPTDTITIVNNGLIQGAGGNGSNGANSPAAFGPASAGGGGGNAIYVNRPTTITNNGTIAGGGGGGGGGGAGNRTTPGGANRGSGGGGGGGAGTNAGSGGAGGTPSVATPAPLNRPGSPGSPGSSPAGGGGGAGGSPPTGSGGAGGAGGGRGAGGVSGNPGNAGIGGSNSNGGAGGATGSYLVGNPFVTWPATGTRQGSVS